jgi:hypothetical protein
VRVLLHFFVVVLRFSVTVVFMLLLGYYIDVGLSGSVLPCGWLPSCLSSWYLFFFVLVVVFAFFR